MLSTLILASTIFFSSQLVQVTNAYQGEDMTDDDFYEYVHSHSRGVSDAATFMLGNFDVVSRGMIGHAQEIGLGF